MEAATIRDRGGMFSKSAVKEAQAILDKVESASGVPIVIETIDAIPGLEKNSSPGRTRRARSMTLPSSVTRQSMTRGFTCLSRSAIT